jgi:hypothetical protein
LLYRKANRIAGAGEVDVQVWQESGIEIVDMRTGSIREAWLEDIRTPQFKARARALLGVSEYVLYVIARHAIPVGRAG